MLLSWLPKWGAGPFIPPFSFLEIPIMELLSLPRTHQVLPCKGVPSDLAFQPGKMGDIFFLMLLPADFGTKIGGRQKVEMLVKSKKGNLGNGESIRGYWQTLLQRQGVSTSAGLVHNHSKSGAGSLLRTACSQQPTLRCLPEAETCLRHV